jgi:hypothetical protein
VSGTVTGAARVQAYSERRERLSHDWEEDLRVSNSPFQGLQMTRVLALIFASLLMPLALAQDPQEASRERLVKEMDHSMQICELVLETKTRFTNARQGLLQTTKDIGRCLHVLCNNPDFKNDNEYSGLITASSGYLGKMRIMINTENYEDTVVAFGKLQKTCSECHDKFR